MVGTIHRLGFALLAAFAAALPVTPAAAAGTLRVGRAIANSWSFVPLDIGVAAGIFAKHDLEIESVAFTGSARLQQGLAAKSIDIGLSSGPELAMVAKGAPVIAVGAIVLSPRMTITVGANSPIRGVQDLRGKQIGVSTAASLTEWLTRELARREGWERGAITAVALGSDAAQIAAMKTGQIDGLVLDVATALRLESAGDGRIVLYFGDIIKDFIQNAAYARRDLLASDPDRVRRFLAAWYETIAYMETHRQESIKVAMPIVDLPEDLAARGYGQWMQAYSRDGRFDPRALSLLAKSFVEMGLLPSAPDMRSLYTEDYLPR
ncbi:MAG TPA: ABC transporter substrate-binding protein [Xanthobacteraceae bacterium]|nr:ABC transporter substrate-binding protein [Xanthobacteraceae bacterium]